MNNLKFWRIERALSQVELSAASQVPRWSIQLFESGIRLPTPEEKRALSETLGVALQKLFPEKTETNAQGEK